MSGVKWGKTWRLYQKVTYHYLKDVRQEKFNSKAATMLEEVRKLKMLIFEQEEPLEAFDEKLFLEIVKSIQINKEDEMSVELLGGLRFRERI